MTDWTRWRREYSSRYYAENRDEVLRRQRERYKLRPKKQQNTHSHKLARQYKISLHEARRHEQEGTLPGRET